MKSMKFIKTISLFIFILIVTQTSANILQTSENENFKKQIYNVTTSDKQEIILTRYPNEKKPPIILIHGMGGNHIMYDWDENHSLSKFLNEDGWDVWMLDLRTHDGDGDFVFSKKSDRDYINRYWDFDNTLLKIDVLTAVGFVKKVTLCDKIFLSGHSYGGYLAYAYAMLIGEENLTGIITMGACPYENPDSFEPSIFEKIKYGFFIGKKAFVNPFGRSRTHRLKIFCDINSRKWEPSANAIFYFNTSPLYIQKQLFYHMDDEPAGVWVDMFFGKNATKYGGHWVDPQTLYDYSENLNKITVPILFLAGDNDTQDPSNCIYCAYENVSSEIKEFYSFANHSHMDLLLGDNSRIIVFPKISNFMNEIVKNTDE